MDKVSTIGLDIAKNVFQVHGVDNDGRVVIRRQLRRPQVLKFFAKLSACLIGIEACATAHHWARELRKFGPGPVCPPAHVADQCNPISSCRIRHCRWRWPQWRRGSAGSDPQGRR